jgi:hypothetical protein
MTIDFVLLVLLCSIHTVIMMASARLGSNAWNVMGRSLCLVGKTLKDEC